MLQPGMIIGGRLRIEQILGAGGMGIVAAATHLELGNKVAVKVLHDELAQNPTIVERFIREARSVVNLKTEHVCRVHDVGRLDNGAPYIVMEMLSGVDLARTIATKPLPTTMAVDYVMQACVAIAEAHAGGIIHRDIKPANLFVTRRLDGGPLVKVLDFGIAKAMDTAGPHLTHTTGMMGSPGYMSPEQLLSARDVDVRTDIWALGVTLYQLLSARMPFPGPTITEIAIKVASDPPAPLEVDPDLRAIIWRCLEKQPDQRYPNVAALASDLARFASSDGRRTAALTAQLSGVQTAVTPSPVAVGASPITPVAMNAQTAAGSMTPAAMSGPTAAGSMTPAMMTPPPFAIGTAPTQAPTPPPTSVAPPRAKWPLVVGALALIGGTVAVMLVINRNDEPAPAPAVATPSDAAAAVAPTPDAALVVATPTDGGDSWASSPGPSMPDASVVEKKEDPDEEMPDIAVVDSDPGVGFVLAEGPQKEQMKQSCRDSLPSLDKPMPGAPAGVMGMAKVQCLCVLGEKAKAKAALATITDAQMKEAAKAACAMYGGFKL